MRKLLVPFGVAALLLSAQTAGRFSLTVDNIMRGPGLVGYEPRQVRWSADSRRVYFEWKVATQREGEPLDTYVVDRDGSGLRKLTGAEAREAPAADGERSPDKRRMIFARDGDLFLEESGAVRQITRTSDVESHPHFLRDGKRIAFTRAGNLFVTSLETGELVQMTDIRPVAAPAAVSPSEEFLKKEQKELFEAVREQVVRREAEEAHKKAVSPLKPFELQARQTVEELRLSPDGKYIIAAVNESATARKTIVPNFVTESSYTESVEGRSNVGDAPTRVRLAAIDAATGEFHWVDHGQKVMSADAKPATEAKDRDVELAMPVWSDDSNAVMLAQSADHKDRWVLTLDPASGKTRVLASDHDDAWIGDPGAETLGWMKNGREVYFESERTGYTHLYAVPYQGGEARALTSGKWEVLDVQQSLDRSHFYLRANRETPYEQHLYEMAGEGGTLTRLTTAPGKHLGVASPDDRWVADVFSYTNRPPELFIQAKRAGADAKRITTSPAPDFAEYPWLDVPIVTFTARDGVDVPARLFKPANFQRGGRAVVFVHGSGYLQNVDRKWSTYYHEYLFHHLLMERGFVVLDVDYRGSAGHGRDWRTAIYRHMGGKDLDDVVDAAQYLVRDIGVDPKKIGIYGGSYGGFLTLMAMFTAPDVFAAGAALRPVTDWATYNHGYTSEILNTPQADSNAFRASSPIYFAGGLKGALLICHGMVDSNVEFQDSVRLAQRLIELRKENWELAVYPVENHTFVQPYSWADEYKRILKLFEKNL